MAAALASGTTHVFDAGAGAAVKAVWGTHNYFLGGKLGLLVHTQFVVWGCLQEWCRL